MSDFVQSIQQLSAFFFASDAKGMKAAYADLTRIDPAPTVDDWSAVEFSFNRLFVGPRALLAPPYASIYLDNNSNRVMSESTMQVRQFYGLLGLVSPWLNKIPDDHIALELDALWQIETALNNSDTPQLRGMRDYLLEHLQEWIPKFRQRIRAIDDVHGAESEGAVLEQLTHNWDTEAYDLGSGYGQVALAVPDAAAACAAIRQRGGKVVREAGPMKHGTTIIAFVEDPDGYKIELIERGAANS